MPIWETDGRQETKVHWQLYSNKLVGTPFMQTIFIIVPGYGNSDEQHWQTYFQRQLPNSCRIAPKSWDKPICEDWIEAIQKEVDCHKASKVMLISHSLGGIAIAHWVSKYPMAITGAFIVAPPNLEDPYKDLGLESFTPIPRQPFPFPSLLIGSTNDPWATPEKTNEFAQYWGSHLQFIGDAGHINSTSGFGHWKDGFARLQEFMLQLGIRPE